MYYCRRVTEIFANIMVLDVWFNNGIGYLNQTIAVIFSAPTVCPGLPACAEFNRGCAPIDRWAKVTSAMPGLLRVASTFPSSVEPKDSAEA